MPQDGGVLVVAEHLDGTVTAATLEVVTAARALADALEGSVTVGVVGADVDDVIEGAAAIAGVDQVVAVIDERLHIPTGTAWTAAVTAMTEHLQPAIVLAAATTFGRDYMPRVAARLNSGHAADAVEITHADGKIVVTRPMFGSRVQSFVAFEGDGIPTVTMRPGSSPRADSTGGSASPSTIDVEFTDSDLAVVADPVEPLEQGGRAQALDQADRIVAGGRGLGEPDNFALVEELASHLGAAVAATRPLSDAGWRPHSDQIGQTGAQVSPRLYIAVGISGAAQHLMGVTNAEYVVAINRDADAPIFKIASFGIVGDLFEVVPAVIAELKAAQL